MCAGISTAWTAASPWGPDTVNFQAFDLLYGGIDTDTFVIHGNETARLYGNVGDDVFQMLDGAVLNGSIDGGGGTNTLDYGVYTTPVCINLSGVAVSGNGLSCNQYSASHVTISIQNIQNIYGGSANDLLVGNSGNNILEGNGGSDLLEGGYGNDIYVFAGGNFGQDTILGETAATGVDTLDFTNDTYGGVTFDLSHFSASNGLNGVDYSACGNVIEHFIGTSGFSDTCLLGDGFSLPAAAPWTGLAAPTTAGLPPLHHRGDRQSAGRDRHRRSGRHQQHPGRHRRVGEQHPDRQQPGQRPDRQCRQRPAGGQRRGGCPERRRRQ